MEIINRLFKELKDEYGLKPFHSIGRRGPLYISNDQKYLVKRFKRNNDLHKYVSRYNEISEKLTSILEHNKHLSRRIRVLPIIACGDDYYIKQFYNSALSAREANEEKEYYPDYIQLKEKFLCHIHDEKLRNIVEVSLDSNDGIFWENGDARLVFNDFQF